jgi:hypothetical protein
MYWCAQEPPLVYIRNQMKYSTTSSYPFRRSYISILSSHLRLDVPNGLSVRQINIFPACVFILLPMIITRSAPLHLTLFYYHLIIWRGIGKSSNAVNAGLNDLWSGFDSRQGLTFFSTSQLPDGFWVCPKFYLVLTGFLSQELKRPEREADCLRSSLVGVLNAISSGMTSLHIFFLSA